MLVIHLVLVVLCFALLHTSDAAISMGIGTCPENRKNGEKWYLSDCQMCICQEGFWTCESCSTGVIDYDPNKCYVQFASDKKFPACCMPYVRCRGNKGFEEKLLLDDVSQMKEKPLNDAPVKLKKIKAKRPNKAKKPNVNKKKKIKVVKLNIQKRLAKQFDKKYY